MKLYQAWITAVCKKVGTAISFNSSVTSHKPFDLSFAQRNEFSFHNGLTGFTRFLSWFSVTPKIITCLRASVIFRIAKHLRSKPTSAELKISNHNYLGPQKLLVFSKNPQNRLGFTLAFGPSDFFPKILSLKFLTCPKVDLDPEFLYMEGLIR